MGVDGMEDNEGSGAAFTTVPVKPTTAMIEAAIHCLDGVNLTKAAARGNAQSATKKDIQVYKVCHRWWAMLAAAPQAPGNGSAQTYAPSTPAAAAPQCFSPPCTAPFDCLQHGECGRRSEAAVTAILEHNAGCEASCKARGAYCEPFTSRGRDCADCPRDWIIPWPPEAR
jgi:hypothetical protein